MSPSCVPLVRTCWLPQFPRLHPDIVCRCHFATQNLSILFWKWHKATSLPLHVCASAGVRPGAWSQRWICGSGLLRGVTFPWPLRLVPGWVWGQVRANETNRLSWGVPERRPFALFLLGCIRQEAESERLKASRYHMELEKVKPGHGEKLSPEDLV